MIAMAAVIALLACFLFVDLVLERRAKARRVLETHGSIRDLEQRNLELDQLLHELDPSEFPAPDCGPLDGDRLDALREEYRAVPPPRRRTLMEQAQVENRQATLAAVDAMLRSYYQGPVRGWNVDKEAVSLMFEAPVVTIHALAGACHRPAEEVRCLLSQQGIAWDPVADTIRGRDAFRFFQKGPRTLREISREQSARR